MPCHQSSSSQQQGTICSLMQFQRDSVWNDSSRSVVLLGLPQIPSMDELNERTIRRLSPRRLQIIPPSPPTSPRTTTNTTNTEINHRRARVVSILNEALEISKSMDLEMMSVPLESSENENTSNEQD